MPTSPPVACRCGGRRIGGRCDRCGPASRASDRARGTRSERGYDNQWLRFARCYLRQHPLCVFCLERGITTAASEVHHRRKLRDNPELKYEESNLAATCKPCHSALTGRGE